MKFIAPLTALSVFALGACTPEPTMDKPTAFDQIVDKRLVGAAGTLFLINSDGTVGGSFQGEPIVGTYTREGKEICSGYTEPEQLRGLTVCSTPVITEGVVIFNRRNGTTSQPYTIEG
ncbi:MAG: hypothetical protein AAFR93_04805 [Pseudomonadota bacterium]